MQLVVISGRSGSGISSALRVLEDKGLTCIDNLPIDLLTHLVDNQHNTDNRYAVTIDTRSNPEALRRFPELHRQLAERCEPLQIIFLDARDDILLRRFSETRRKHPLSSSSTDLQAAISQESQLLSPISELATREIDTSDLGLHELRSLIQKTVTGEQYLGLALQFQSFGFKRGVPAEADLIFDARCLPNPYWVAELKHAGGNDPEVEKYLAGEPLVADMLQDIRDFVHKWLPRYAATNRSYITVAVGCTGGQHRSVYLCNQLADHFKSEQASVLVRHRDLKQPKACN